MVKVCSKIVFFFLLFLLFTFAPSKIFAATLSLTPASGTFEVGQSVTVKVIATSSTTPYNAVSGVVAFPSTLFSIESISKTSSIVDFWVTEPIISNSTGTVKFEGIALGGGGVTSGTVITINLRATKVGIGTASFQSGQILANDGNGTNITGDLIGGNYSVKEATAKPRPLPLPETPPTTVVPEPAQPAPTLKAPEIILGTKYGAEAIVGTSDYGGAQALITFVAEDGTKVFVLGLADSSGNFAQVVPNSLKHGTYTVTAVMIEADKQSSETSNEIIVKVGSIISDISWQVSLLILLLILAIIYLILRTHIHFSKNHKAKDAENIIHKSFDILREDVLDNDNKKLTSAEHKRMSGIKKDIDSAEKVITKEVRDFE